MPALSCKILQVMSGKPASASSELQTRAFDPLRRGMVLADLAERAGLVGGYILPRDVTNYHFVIQVQITLYVIYTFLP
jgi:hypothetical protein